MRCVRAGRILVSYIVDYLDVAAAAVYALKKKKKPSVYFAKVAFD